MVAGSVDERKEESLMREEVCLPCLHSARSTRVRIDRIFKHYFVG